MGLQAFSETGQQEVRAEEVPQGCSGSRKTNIPRTRQGPKRPRPGPGKSSEPLTCEKDRWQKIIDLSSINVAHINIRSALNKKAELTLLCEEKNLDILALTETFFLDNHVKIKGYVCVSHDDRLDTPNGHFGGAAIYVKEDLATAIKEIPIIKPKINEDRAYNVQICAIEIVGRTIVVLYRPPSQTEEEYRLMPKLVTDHFAKTENLVLLGDFNMPAVNWQLHTGPNGSAEQALMEKIIELNLEQLVHVSTHKRGNILDLVAVTNQQEIEELEVTPTEEFSFAGSSVSDHYLVNFRIRLNIKVECLAREVLLHKDANWDFFRQRLAKTDWNYVEQSSTTVSIFYDNIILEINDAYLSCVPKKIIYPDRPKKEYIRLKKQVRKVQNCKRKQNWRAFKKERQILTKMIREEKRKELVAYLGYLEKSKFNVYKTLKQLKGEHKEIGPVRGQDGILKYEDKEKAEAFLNQFQSVFTKQSFRTCNSEDKHPEAKATVDDMTFTQDEVYNEMRTLPPKTSAGESKISNLMLKMAAYELAWPLSNLFNLSMKHSEIPINAMTIKVVPISKAGQSDRASPAAFRPIGMCCNVIKVQEGLFIKKVHAKWKEEDVFESNQYGFTEGIGREDKLIAQIQWLTENLDNGSHMDAVYFDFSKAFDVISHGLLLDKFHKQGLGKLPLKWLEAWLGLGYATTPEGNRIRNQRKQFVQVGQVKSSMGLVTSSVIQGSKVGPYCFRVYINDLLVALNACGDTVKSFVYADDLCIVGLCKTEEQRRLLQKAINIAAQWSSRNYLAYNTSKIFVLHHSANIRSSSNPRHVYALAGEAIKSTKHQKDLGVWMDEGLNFDHHHEIVAARLLTAVGKAKQIAKGCNYRTLCFIWDTYLLPIAQNGSLVAAANNKQSVHDLYNKAYRRMFSRVKVKAGEKVAYPPQFSWIKRDMKWIFDLRSNRLACFNPSQFIRGVEDGASCGVLRSNLYKRTKKSLYRNAHRHHSHSLGPLQTRPVNTGAIGRRTCVVGRTGRLMANIYPTNTQHWPSVEKAIERDIYPTLYSYPLVQKLIAGELYSRADAVANLAKVPKI